ncbi:hypothetical protein EAE99_009186 [Botrytis elliptica]|nr:hypothetical protein EAE99_009186 [Botrytis elliptica]
MSMPPPPKYTRDDRFLKEQWSSYLRMSFKTHSDQAAEEFEVIGIINNKLKEYEDDMRYSTCAKIMAIYKKLPSRSSDPDPDRTFIINRARYYYGSDLTHWRLKYNDYPKVKESFLLREIQEVCGVSYSITELGTYYLRHKKPEYEDPILEEWSKHWKKVFDNSRCRDGERPDVVARLVHFFDFLTADHGVELYYNTQIELPNNRGRYPSKPVETTEEFQARQRYKMYR